MSFGTSPCFDGVASENISPARFVKLGTAYPKEIQMCDTLGERAFGVSQPGTRRVPLDGLDDGFAAIATENVSVFGQGQPAWLEAAAVVAHGAFLATDANGRGITAVATNFVNAQAIQEATAANQLILVNVLAPTVAALA